MTVALDPERIKAICKQRWCWYVATCFIGTIAAVVFFSYRRPGPGGHVSPVALGAIFLSVAAIVFGDLIWRCPGDHPAAILRGDSP